MAFKSDKHRRQFFAKINKKEKENKENDKADLETSKSNENENEKSSNKQDTKTVQDSINIQKQFEEELDKEINKIINKYKFSEKLSSQMPKFLEINKKIIYKAETENEKKGRLYELKIKKHFENEGYKIFPNGFVKGKKDGGIDIVGYKDNEYILIQCKNHKNPIGQDMLRKFIGDCAVYMSENEKYCKNKEVRRIFVSSSEARNNAQHYLNDYANLIEFLQIDE